MMDATATKLDFDVIFDNGGGTTLQTKEHGGVHIHYTDATQAAEDVRSLLDGDTTDGWEGNEPENMIAYDVNEVRNGGYKWFTREEIEEACFTGAYAYGWHNTRMFFKVLGCTILDDATN